MAHRIEKVDAFDVMHGLIMPWHEMLCSLRSLCLLEKGSSTDACLHVQAVLSTCQTHSPDKGETLRATSLSSERALSSASLVEALFNWRLQHSGFVLGYGPLLASSWPVPGYSGEPARAHLWQRVAPPLATLA